MAYHAPRDRRWVFLIAESAVDIAPVGNAHDEHEKNFASDLIENLVITHAQAVQLVPTLDLLDSMRVRILRERVDPLLYPSPYGTIESFEFPLRARGEFDSVSQL